jgi:flagellin
MPISILTNESSSLAVVSLNKAEQLHQENISRLSSGSRINGLSDDSGAHSVSLKLTSALKRNAASQANVSNALSFLQAQAGGLKTLSAVLNRMSELVTLMKDQTKDAVALDNYVAEMSRLSAEIDKVRNGQFNGVDLFNHGGSPAPLSVQLSDDGTQFMDLTISDLASAAFEAIIAHCGTFSEIDPRGDSGGLGDVAFMTATEELSTLMANNGSQQSRLEFVLGSLGSASTDTEAANSRISDVDVAKESTRLSRSSMTQEARIKALSQANSASQLALKLIQQQG